MNFYYTPGIAIATKFHFSAKASRQTDKPTKILQAYLSQFFLPICSNYIFICFVGWDGMGIQCNAVNVKVREQLVGDIFSPYHVCIA